MKKTFAFRSRLAPIISRYLKLNFALGKRYKHEVTTLKSLDRFLSRLPRAFQDLNSETFHAWCDTQAELTSRVRRNRMWMIQRFCRYRRRTTPDCFIPDSIFFPPSSQTVTPYIFSPAQVAKLMKAAARLERPSYSPLRPEVVRLAVVLLYTTGLRIGELLRLVVRDFDPQQGTLLVRNSKFHKSRILPLHKDVVDELEQYLRLRRRRGFPVSPDTPLIWNLRQGGRAYSAWGLQCSLSDLLDSCKIRTRSGRHPRFHDFRHSFAVNALTRWYRSENDLRTKLPFLATYLGHIDIGSSYRYLHFVEPLRSLASKRFSQFFGGLVVSLSGQEAPNA